MSIVKGPRRTAKYFNNIIQRVWTFLPGIHVRFNYIIYTIVIKR